MKTKEYEHEGGFMYMKVSYDESKDEICVLLDHGEGGANIPAKDILELLGYKNEESESPVNVDGVYEIGGKTYRVEIFENGKLRVWTPVRDGDHVFERKGVESAYVDPDTIASRLIDAIPEPERKRMLHGDFVKRDIGWMLDRLHDGEIMRRASWNAPNQWIVMYIPYGPCKEIEAVGASGSFPITKHILLKNAQDELIPWQASQGDLLATDWEFYQDPE